MKHNSIHTRLTVMLCLLATLITSCSHDEVEAEQPTQYLQMVTSSVSTLQAPVATRAFTRAENPFVPGTEDSNVPAGVPTFVPYSEMYPSPINKDYTTVGAFLAEDSRNSYTSISGYFRYEGSNKWSSTVGVKAETDNFIFGYMPSNTSQTLASITKRDDSTTWADGAILTLKNLPAATPADVCVVVGVLKANVPNTKPQDWTPAPITDPKVVANLHQGKYDYKGTESDNYVYLLLEHIYANINVELSVEPRYAELRNIVLKDVHVRVKLPGMVDCTMELCNDQIKPIKNIHFDPVGDEAITRARLFTDADSMLIKTTPQSIPLYFSPYLPDEGFDYEFLYDVYDREGEDLSDPEHPKYGNLVRENCVAINHWAIHGFSVEAGKSFKANVVIKPTYLFMLSEPDLDNPTFELNSVITPDPEPDPEPEP